MADADDREKGREWFEKVMGFPAPPLQGDAFLDLTLEHLFANVWSRPALGVKERRIATLVVLMCLGHEATLKLHLGAALKTGQLTRRGARRAGGPRGALRGLAGGRGREPGGARASAPSATRRRPVAEARAAGSLRARAQRRARPRRSHAERTAETRALLMDAVVESIAEVGLARTTAPEIARRAGVTWGAVQHHFGGKDGMLVASSTTPSAASRSGWRGSRSRAPRLEERAALFIDRAWEHFASAHYRSTYEILLHYLGREDARRRGATGATACRATGTASGAASSPTRACAARRHYVLQHTRSRCSRGSPRR